MNQKSIVAWFVFTGIVLSPDLLYGASFYPERLDDPAAVYLPCMAMGDKQVTATYF